MFQIVFHEDVPSLEDEQFLAATQILNFPIQGTNKYGPIVEDQEIFASEQVHYVGEVLGVVVARDQTLAERAAKLVRVSYQDLPNPIFTIEVSLIKVIHNFQG